MNMEGFGAIAETAGAFAVVVSLIYVAKQVRASTEQSISDRLCETLMTGASSDLGLIIVKGISDNGDLSEEEQARFVLFMSGWLRTMEQAHRQYRRGYLDKSIWMGYEAYLHTLVSTRLIKAYWKERQTIFNEDFRKLIAGMDGETTPLSFGITPAASSSEDRS